MEKDRIISNLNEIKYDVERILRQPKKEQKHLVGSVVRKIENLIENIEEG